MDDLLKDLFGTKLMQHNLFWQDDDELNDPDSEPGPSPEPGPEPEPGEPEPGESEAEEPEPGEPEPEPGEPEPEPGEPEPKEKGKKGVPIQRFRQVYGRARTAEGLLDEFRSDPPGFLEKYPDEKQKVLDHYGLSGKPEPSKREPSPPLDEELTKLKEDDYEAYLVEVSRREGQRAARAEFESLKKVESEERHQAAWNAHVSEFTTFCEQGGEQGQEFEPFTPTKEDLNDIARWGLKHGVGNLMIAFREMIRALPQVQSAAAIRAAEETKNQLLKPRSPRVRGGAEGLPRSKVVLKDPDDYSPEEWEKLPQATKDRLKGKI